MKDRFGTKIIAVRNPCEVFGDVKDFKFPCRTCKRVHKLDMYAVAHFNDNLTHTCKCGQETRLCCGVYIQPRHPLI